jgi:ABC-type glycerol-3-phosphate transport system substrate-binding protein
MKKIALGVLVATAVFAAALPWTTFAATPDVTTVTVHQFTPSTVDSYIPETPVLSNQDYDQGDD